MLKDTEWVLVVEHDSPQFWVNWLWCRLWSQQPTLHEVETGVEITQDKWHVIKRSWSVNKGTDWTFLPATNVTQQFSLLQHFVFWILGRGCVRWHRTNLSIQHYNWVRYCTRRLNVCQRMSVSIKELFFLYFISLRTQRFFPTQKVHYSL